MPPSSKEQKRLILDQEYKDKAAAAEKNWLKGGRTAMAQNILDAGRQKL